MGKSDNIVVIRDAQVVSAALRGALADASAETRAGLERAVTIVESTAAATASRLRGDWVRARLADVGFAGDLTSAAAVKALRQAEPGLSLMAAVRLRNDAVDHPA
ncbi:hypothetical protein OHB00_45615 [Streptomyces sp. NBC_00631]|uniref:hypothetical protein n=1 Tax=Streptomyces sp. NBC_00631 TaxID=2975793 RepID=UPI0030E10572